MATVGFIGLGNMGRPMAANLAAAGHRLCVHDAVGSAERAPEGATSVNSVVHVAAVADPILLSLPDGAAVRSVVDEIRESPNAVTHTIVDTSTIGIAAARSIGRTLFDDGFEYVDAPVSGGVAGARAATLAIMFAGSSAAWNRLRSLLEPLCRHLVYVGRRPGAGAGHEGPQQLPVGHRDGGHERGGRVRTSAGSRHGHHAGRAERLVRDEHRHRRQVPRTGC